MAGLIDFSRPAEHLLAGGLFGDSLPISYAEQFEWSQAIAIPENGITIQRDQGDVLRYLQRYRRDEPDELG